MVWIGEIWNVLEAVVALWSGIGAGSVALIGFGLDSILELTAGGILIWRLQTKWEDEEDESGAEKKAHKVVGITFFVLAGYLLFSPSPRCLVTFRNRRKKHQWALFSSSPAQL